MRLGGGGHRRLAVAFFVVAAGGLYASPAFAGAPNVSWVSPSSGFVGPSTDFVASATDTGTGVGNVQFEYSSDGTSNWTTFATAAAPGIDGNYHGIWNTSLPSDGLYFVRAEAFDTTTPTALSSATSPVSVTLDATPPTIHVGCDANGEGPELPCGWFQSNQSSVLLCANANDSGSGLAKALYTADGTDPLTSSTAQTYSSCVTSFSSSGPVDTPLWFVAVDNAGNTATFKTHIGFDDALPPAPVITLGADSIDAYVQQTAPDGFQVWYKPDTAGAAVLTVSPNDGQPSGVGSVSFATSGLPTGWGVSDVGPLTATYSWEANLVIPPFPPSFTPASTSGAGVSGPSSNVGFAPDSTAPTGAAVCVPASCTNSSGPVQVSISPTDGAGSGVQQVRYTTDGTDPTANTGTAGTSVLVTTPNTTVKFWGIDNVGNSIVMASEQVSQASAAPTVSIDSSPSGPTSDAKITWSSTSSGVTFQCRLRTAAWIPFTTCGTSVEYNDLPAGSYTFGVEAVSGGIPGPPSSVSFVLSYGGSLPTSLTRFTNGAVDSLGPALDTTGETVTYAFNGDLAASDLLQSGGAASVVSGATPSGIAISRDGRFIAFASSAGNVTPDSTSGTSQIYVYDRVTGTTMLVSRATDGTVGDGDSTQPAISSEGRYVAWTSSASNFVAGTTGSTQIYRRDLATGTTVIVSGGPGGTGCDANVQDPSISGDGNLVAFDSTADDCLTTSNGGGVYVADVSAGTTEIASPSIANPGFEANGTSTNPRISADGRYVVFSSTSANDLVPNAPLSGTGIFVRDRQAQTTTLISGNLPNDMSPDISDDGNTVAFVSTQAEQKAQVYVARNGGTPQQISQNSAQLAGDGDSLDPSLSRDGKYVAFDSKATNLTTGDTNGVADIFIAPTNPCGVLGNCGFENALAPAQKNLCTTTPAAVTFGNWLPFDPCNNPNPPSATNNLKHSGSFSGEVSSSTDPSGGNGELFSQDIQNASFDPNQGFVLSSWVEVGQGYTQAELLFDWDHCCGAAAGTAGFKVDAGAGTISFDAWGQSTTVPVSTNFATFHQVELDADGSTHTSTLLVDGVQVGSITAPGSAYALSPSFNFPHSTLALGDLCGDASAACIAGTTAFFDDVSLTQSTAAPAPTDQPQPGPTFTVNTAADHDDGVCSVQDCTFREAINAANAGDGPQTIDFAIGTGGAQTIFPTSPLPPVTSPTTIDGTSQPGFLGPPLITIDGSQLDGASDGIVIQAVNSTVRGLVIDNFSLGLTGGIGIHVLADGATIAGDYLGVDASGTIAAGNGGDGVRVENANDATIGGPAAADMNVVAGNGGHGIFLANSTGSTVEGNYSGFDVHGETAIPNGIDGIAVDGGGQNVIENNVSSGNTNQGISLFGVNFGTTTGDTVRGNDTGTAPFGDGLIPNGGDGILVASGTGHIIGGAAQGQGNLTEGNHGDGIHLANESGAVVAGNTISNNAQAGVQIDATAPNNTIGVDVAGTDPNTITGNGGAGVSVLSSGNAILDNSIDTNGKGGGIDLNGVGNGLQAAPALGSAQASGTTLKITGKFVSPGGGYRIEFFVSPTCGPQGVTFLGRKLFTVGPSGGIAISATAIGLTTQGMFVTATATSAANNTSAFSNCLAVTTAGTATSSNLSLTTDVQNTLPGAASVPLADIPQSAFGQVTLDSNGNPVPPSIGLGSIGLGSIGLGSIGLGSIGLGSIGLGSIGLTDATLLENGLGGIPLNTLPLKPPLSWETLLSTTSLKGLPIQTLTVKDVLDRAPSTLAGIGLGSIDLTHSGLGSIGLGSIALGSIGLGSIPLDSNRANTPTQNLAEWCTFIHAVPGFASFDCSSLGNQTVLGLALQGVPVASGLGSIGLGSIDLSSTGLGSIGLGSIDIADSGLGSIGLGSIGLGSIGLGSIGLGSIDLAGTGLGSIGLGSINLAASGLGSIGLGSIGATLGNVVDCTLVDCATGTTETLGQAAAAGALKPTATLGDLTAYLQAHPDQFPLAQLGYYGDVTLGDLAQYLTGTLADLLPALPPTATVDDLLSALLGGTPRDWENTPLAGLAAFAGKAGAKGGLVTYSATFTIQGTGNEVATLTVTPPAGAFYVPGSAQLVGVGTQGDPIRSDTGTLSWTLSSLTFGTTYTFKFQLRPGLTLGPEQATATLSTTGIQDVTKQASVTVTDTNEPNDSPTTNATPINPATLYLSYLGNGKDVDYYTLPVDPSAAPAGTIIKVFISHLHSDDDLAVFGPGEPPLRGSGLGSIGLGSIGLGSIAPGEQPVEPGEQSQPLQSDPAQDLPIAALPSGDQLVGVSNNRGTASEEVDITSAGQAQNLLVQVSSYDGNPTTDPYLLRVEYDKPPALPACSQTAPGGTGIEQATLPTNASIPASAQTLILFNEKRFSQYYGTANAQAVYSRLVTYAGQSTVNGVIVPVELNGAVASAYANWDSNLCSPAAANGVVKAIGSLLDTLQANHPNLSSLVLVGADNVIPFARLLDQTQQANEVGFRSNFGFVNNEYVGAVAAGYLFSDDPYGDPSPRQFGNGFLYTPRYALGRLVETPADIEKQLDAYDLTYHGVINPTSKLVSGYDFLTDGAQAVDSALPGTDTATDLINDTWTADQLRTDLFSSAKPVIDSLNAHYDQHQALSAAGNAAHDESAPNLFTTSQLPANSVLGRIVFTMGCHAGFSLFDGLQYVPSPATNPVGFTLDWPQAYMEGGAIAFMGNTGYGLGDTSAVGYSERLNQLFAQRLNGTMTLGQALEFAKQEYFGDLGVVGAYDQKVANEATLYGLPTYRLGTGTPPAAPPTLPTYIDPATGLTAADFTAQPTFTQKTSPVPGGGAFFQVTNDPNGLGVQVTNRRPIEPLTSLDVTEAGTTAHGVFITSLASQNHPGFQVAFGRVAVANSAIEPQLTGISDFPAQIQSLVNVATPNGPRQRAVLIAGHFASGTAGNVGTQRNYTSIGGTVLYSNSQDFVRPTITDMQVLSAGSTVGFAANISDLDQNGQPGTVTEAIVLYLDGSGVWQRANLTCVNGHCSGGGPLTGTSVDYIGEAVDAAGNVGVNANKAATRDITPPNNTGGHISLSLQPNTVTNGWLTGPSPTAVVSSDDGATLFTSLDGAAYTNNTSVPVTGDGVHVLDVRGSDGSTATFAIPVDTQPPTITFFGPGGSPFVFPGDPIFYVCADAGSGLAASGGCVGSVPSGTVTSTVTVTSRDNAGHTTSRSVQFAQWTGFLPPVNNPPYVNSVKSGSSVPIKFSLGANYGLNLFAAGYPGSQQVNCSTTAPVDTITSTGTAGQSSLAYDSTSNTYTYTWKTDSSWVNTCRELTVKLRDGFVRKAEFKFSK